MRRLTLAVSIVFLFAWVSFAVPPAQGPNSYSTPVVGGAIVSSTNPMPTSGILGGPAQQSSTMLASSALSFTNPITPMAFPSNQYLGPNQGIATGAANGPLWFLSTPYLLANGVGYTPGSATFFVTAGGTLGITGQYSAVAFDVTGLNKPMVFSGTPTGTWNPFPGGAMFAVMTSSGTGGYVRADQGMGGGSAWLTQGPSTGTTVLIGSFPNGSTLYAVSGGSLPIWTPTNLTVLPGNTANTTPWLVQVPANGVTVYNTPWMGVSSPGVNMTAQTMTQTGQTAGIQFVPGSIAYALANGLNASVPISATPNEIGQTTLVTIGAYTGSSGQASELSMEGGSGYGSTYNPVNSARQGGLVVLSLPTGWFNKAIGGSGAYNMLSATSWEGGNMGYAMTAVDATNQGISGGHPLILSGTPTGTWSPLPGNGLFVVATVTGTGGYVRSDQGAAGSAAWLVTWPLQAPSISATVNNVSASALMPVAPAATSTWFVTNTAANGGITVSPAPSSTWMLAAMAPAVSNTLLSVSGSASGFLDGGVTLFTSTPFSTSTTPTAAQVVSPTTKYIRVSITGTSTDYAYTGIVWGGQTGAPNMNVLIRPDAPFISPRLNLPITGGTVYVGAGSSAGGVLSGSVGWGNQQ